MTVISDHDFGFVTMLLPPQTRDSANSINGANAIVIASMVTVGNTSLTPLKTDMVAARRRYVRTADGSRKADHCVANGLMIQV